MRTAVLFAGLMLAGAADVTSCALNGARAVDDLLDSATYVWASVQRCSKGASGNQILCSMDVASAIEAMNAMVNVVLKGVEECGSLDSADAKCGLSVGVLTKTFAGVAASSSGVTAKCPNALNNNQGLTYLVNKPKVTAGDSALASAAQMASFAQCIVNVKDLTKNIFKASKRLVTVKGNCDGDDSKACAHNALKVVASLASMGEFLAGSIGRCSANTAANAKLKGDAQCTAEATDLLGSLNRMASAGIAMKQSCLGGEARLFELEHAEGSEEKRSNGLTVGLAALLPVTAVVAFVGGSRFAKRGAQDSELLVQE